MRYFANLNKLECDILHKIYYKLYLPLIPLLLTVIDEVARPSIVTAGISDDLLLLRSNQPLPFPHLKIDFTTECCNEIISDGTLHPAWHVVIEMGQPPFHHHSPMLTVHGTIRCTHLGMQGIHGCLCHRKGTGILLFCDTTKY